MSSALFRLRTKVEINYVLIIYCAYFGNLILGIVPSIVNILYIQRTASVDFSCFRKISAQRYICALESSKAFEKLKLATTNEKWSLTNMAVVILECSSKCKVRIQFAKSALTVRPFFLFCQPEPPLFLTSLALAGEAVAQYRTCACTVLQKKAPVYDLIIRLP